MQHYQLASRIASIFQDPSFTGEMFYDSVSEMIPPQSLHRCAKRAKVTGHYFVGIELKLWGVN